MPQAGLLLLLSLPVLALSEKVQVVHLDPSSAAEHKVRVVFLKDEPGCNGTSVWVSVPKMSSGYAGSGVQVTASDAKGSVVFSGVLSLTSIDYSRLASPGADPGTAHPIYRAGGFHGAYFCVRSELMPSTEVTALYGAHPYEVRHALFLGPLSKWLAK